MGHSRRLRDVRAAAALPLTTAVMLQCRERRDVPQADTTARLALAGHLGQSRRRSGTFDDRYDARAPKAGVLPLSVFGALLPSGRFRRVSASLPSGSGKVAEKGSF
jgi:hypothetical protein